MVSRTKNKSSIMKKYCLRVMDLLMCSSHSSPASLALRQNEIIIFSSIIFIDCDRCNADGTGVDNSFSTLASREIVFSAPNLSSRRFFLNLNRRQLTYFVLIALYIVVQSDFSFEFVSYDDVLIR